LGLGNQAFHRLLAGGAELGCYNVFGIVEVLVGFDFVLVLFADDDGLPDDDVWFGEIDLEIALLSHRHAAHDDVELLGEQRRDDAVPRGVHRDELTFIALAISLAMSMSKTDEGTRF